MGSLNTEMSEADTMNDFAVKLKLIHHLSEVDQSVSRSYARYMFIFDFPIVNETTVNKAESAIRRGLEVAFKHYPFLTGMLGPANHPEKDYLLLRYGHTNELRRVRDDIFKIRIHEDNELVDVGGYHTISYAGMPTSCLKMQDFCATKPDWKLPRWVPAFAMQANFVDHEALILCLEFQCPVADDTSIIMFLEKFAAGIRGDLTIDNVGEYEGCDVDSVLEDEVEEHLEIIEGEKFPEWDFSSVEVPPGTDQDSYLVTVAAKTVEEFRERIENYIRRNFRGEQNFCVSSVDCISALCWVYITRARVRHSAFYTTAFSTAVNTRSEFAGKILQTQFGNMHTTATKHILVSALSPEKEYLSPTDFMPGRNYMPVANFNEIATAARMIRKKLATIDQNHVLQHLAHLVTLENPNEALVAAQRACRPWQSGIKFQSLADLGADINFSIPGTAGDGTPRFCRKPWSCDEGVIDILPRKGGTEGGDANWEILMCLPDKTIHHVLEEMRQFLEAYVYDNNPHKHWKRRGKIAWDRRTNVNGTESFLF